MKRKRVLLASPIYDQVTVPYFLGILAAVRHDLGVDLIPAVARGCYVQTGRDACVDEARKHDCDDILFVDVDMAPKLEHFARILGHDVDIVGAMYAKKVAGEPEWTGHAIGGAPLGDLVPSADVPTGFMKVKMRVFEAIESKFPNRHYQDGAGIDKIQWFPVSLVAVGSHLHPAELKLAQISAILETFEEHGLSAAGFAEIMRVMRKKVPCHVTGDDVSFQRLAMACGFQPYIDSKLFLRHHGDIGYPAKQLMT